MPRYRTATLFFALSLGIGCVQIPPAQPQSQMKHMRLDQGWSAADFRLFQHQTQGASGVPYEWFIALEQPEIKFVGEVGLFRDPEYLSRFGLLPDMEPVSDTEWALRPVACEPKVGPDVKPSDPAFACGLPAGLARARVTNPTTGQPNDVMGFSCAACHTGEIHHRGTALRIEGATNIIDVTQFQTALSASLMLNQRFPFRFTRFANRVLKARGIDPTSADHTAARNTLRHEFDTFMAAKEQKGEVVTALKKRLYVNHPGGFGRTDALARIGNWIFGTELDNDANLVAGEAPVKFPSIWDAPYFAWAQYNGSVEQSMVRNVGEVLGVRARIDFNPGGKIWGESGEQESVLTSTVDVPGLYSLELLLRGVGEEYFNGLRSPVWPEATLGAIAWERANRGRQLYQTHCQGCHLAPVADIVDVVDWPGGSKGLGPRGTPVHQVAGDPKSPIIGLNTPVPGGGAGSQRMYWIANNHPSMLSGLRTTPFDRTEYFLDLPTIELGTIRTDPGQAANFAKRLIDTGDALLPSFPQYNNGPALFPVRLPPIGVALQMVTIDITTRFYDRIDAQTPAAREAWIQSLPANLREPGALRGLFTKEGKIDRDEWNGYRAPGAVANIGYRPHPLNGVWASPPYLHNGSVPNLYELLSPYEERSKVFYTGSREYDLDRIGYRSERFRGAFRYDTAVTGNSNYGHLFQDGGPGNGVIGPLLTPDDRRAVIEYLKTLCPAGLQTDFRAGGPTLCKPLPGLTGAR